MKVGAYVVLGAILFFAGAIIAMNVAWVEGTTLFSYWFSVGLAAVFFLIAGASWITAAMQIRREEKPRKA